MYLLNSNLQLSTLENSDEYLCTVHVGNRRRSYVVSSSIAAIIDYCKISQEKADIETFSIEKQYLTNANFDAFFQHFLVEKNILLPADGNIVEPAFNDVSLKLKLKLISSSIVNYVTPPLLVLFRKDVVAFFVFSFVGSLIYLAWFISSEQFAQQTSLLTQLDSLCVIVLIVLGLIFHEFGHAAAAYKYGCRRVDIGVGWYIYFIVFYAELSEVWRLDRRKRVIIDFAGSYFQTIFGVLLWLLYLSTENFIFLSASALLALYSLFNLNPFFRMDGYWIASDLMNVKNLRSEAHSIIKSFFFKPKQLITKLKLNKQDNALSRPILIYAAGMVTFYLWFTYYVYTFLFPNSLLTIYSVALTIFAEPWGGLGFTLSLAQLVWHLLVIYFVAYYSVSMLRKIPFRSFSR